MEVIHDVNRGKQLDPDFDATKKKEIQNVVLSLSNGRLGIYGVPPNLRAGRECEIVNTHHGNIKSLKISHDSTILVSAGQDGTLFVYRISSAPNKNIGCWSRKV